MFSQINAELKAASFAKDVAEQRRMQSETLSAVFEIFFRVLKHAIQPRYIYCTHDMREGDEQF